MRWFESGQDMLGLWVVKRWFVVSGDGDGLLMMMK